MTENTHEAARYGEDTKSGVTRQEAGLFNLDEARVARVIVECLGVEANKVTREADFANDLGADSLDVIDLTFQIEEEFGITLPDDKAESVKTVADLFTLVAEIKA